MGSNGGGQSLAGLAIGARHGHQVLHRGVSADLALADSLLHRLGELLDQAHTPRDPAHTAIESPGQSLKVHPEAPVQLAEQPSLLERRFRLGLAQRTAEYERLDLAHRPHRGLDRVAAQTAQRAYALVTVDHHEAARFRRSDYYDRYLLAMVGQRGEQPPFVLRAPHAQSLVAHVELVEIQLHRVQLRQTRVAWEDRCVTAWPRNAR